jgi:hypothetical protein
MDMPHRPPSPPREGVRKVGGTDHRRPALAVKREGARIKDPSLLDTLRVGLRLWRRPNLWG